jgi:hypothetical protein
MKINNKIWLRQNVFNPMFGMGLKTQAFLRLSSMVFKELLPASLLIFTT